MSLSPRFSGLKNSDNTNRQFLNDYQAPVFAASMALGTKNAAAKTIFAIALTGALALSIGVGSVSTPPFLGDEVTILFTPDGSSRTVTFGAGFLATAATLIVTTGKFGLINFIFNGTGWVEQARSVNV